MFQLGPGVIDQVGRLRKQVVDLGRLHGLSGRQMAQICGVKEKRVRSYVSDPNWVEDRLELLVTMEAALASLGLLCSEPPALEQILQAGPVDRAEGGVNHRKVYLDQPAALLDEQLRYIAVYMRAAAHQGIVRERDISFRRLRARSPECAIHVYEASGLDLASIRVARWLPMSDYWGGRDINGADIRSDFPSGMAECIREDVTAALRLPSRPHWTFLRRQFPKKEVDIPDRSFLRLLQFFVGDGDVPKVLVARRLQPAEAASHYLDGLR